MKRKSTRDIPEFLHARPATPKHHEGHVPPPVREAAPPPLPRQAVKPQATNAKSGRRGQ